VARLRERLIEVVDSLRRDIDAGNTRDCQAAIEDLSNSLIELEESDVPANYVVRLRQEQAGLRRATLRIYHIQREEFLPSAYAMIVSFVALILLLLLFTTIEGSGRNPGDGCVPLVLFCVFVAVAQGDQQAIQGGPSQRG
jgi:hypothetical protein